jgi:deoxyadenosine/deoxycytidine kinase
MTILFVEGNIGSGKSTFLQMCEDSFAPSSDGRFTRVITVPEDVDDWMKKEPELDGTSVFDLFYHDKKRHAYTFQSFVLLSRVSGILKAIRERNGDPNTVIVCERSYMTDLEVFARCLYNHGDMGEADMIVYKRWHKTVEDIFKDLYGESLCAATVYLRADPETSYERIQQRARRSEDVISLEYIADLHDRHEAWLLHPNMRDTVVFVDANKDYKNDKDAAREMIQYVVESLINSRQQAEEPESPIESETSS